MTTNQLDRTASPRTAPAAPLTVGGVALHSLPMRPRGPRRHAAPAAALTVNGVPLKSIPTRPRGPRRHMAPVTAFPSSVLSAVPSTPAPVAFSTRRERLNHERTKAVPDLVVPQTRRELRLARGNKPQRGGGGYATQTAAWRENAPMMLAATVRSDPYPAYIANLKDFRANWALSVLLGHLGADRFHRGLYATGALKLLTFGGAGFWWATDQLAVASGRAVTRGGHAMTGKRSHRVLASTISLAVIAGAGVSLTVVAAPHAGEASHALLEIIAPTPAQPVWEDLASLSGDPGVSTSAPFTVTGDGVSFEYDLQGAGFVYLVPAGTDHIADDAEPLISTLDSDTGKVTRQVDGGEYSLVVQSPKSNWSVRISQRVLR